MRALVYYRLRGDACEEVREPSVVDDMAAVGRVDDVAICGTDQ